MPSREPSRLSLATDASPTQPGQSLSAGSPPPPRNLHDVTVGPTGTCLATASESGRLRNDLGRAAGVSSEWRQALASMRAAGPRELTAVRTAGSIGDGRPTIS
jgi:hypothetical protein